LISILFKICQLKPGKKGYAAGGKERARAHEEGYDFAHEEGDALRARGGDDLCAC
jgi:hypothetical protein